jgi:hypothetical protein
MRRFLMHVTLAVAAAAIISPVWAQIPAPAAASQWPSPAYSQWPPPAYFGGAYQTYPLPAVTPQDAYRQGLINRWELERLEGPLPQALQGPSADGGQGGDGGGGRD